MATRMQQRRGTAAQWISTNSGNGPILSPGEIGFESDTNKFKIGDGVNHWVDLTYFTDAESVTTALNSIIDGAPAALNTLNELAAALGDNPNFLSGLATETYVDTAVANVEVDLSTAAGTNLEWNAGTSQFDVDTASLLANPTISSGLTLDGTGDFTISADANIILDATTEVYIGSSASGNEVATQSYVDTAVGNVDLSTKQDVVSGVSSTEIGYLDGVTSAIQTQIDAKAPLNAPTFTGTVTASNDLVVDGDFTVNGTNFSASATSITIEDNLVQIAHNNPANTVDLGLVVGYNDGTAKHAGLVKDTSANTWKLFKGVTTEPATTVDFTQGSLDDLAVAGLTASSLTVGDVSNVEFGYLNGVTSAIQTQLDAKASLTGAETLTNKTLTSPVISTISNTGTITVPSTTGTLALTSQLPTTATPTTAGTVFGRWDAPNLNVGFGFQSLATVGSGGIRSTAIGYQVMQSGLTTGGEDNTGVGYQALQLASSGPSNTAVGSSAAASTTSGNSNTAIGASALRANNTGRSNTAIGESSLRLLNDATHDNTAVGRESGYAVTFGASNVLIGYRAGYSGTNNLTTGSNNIIIGSNAAATSNSVSNQITLGNASITSFRIPGLSLTVDSSNPIVQLTSTQTLTNKTLTSPVISTITNTGTLTLPTSTDTLVGRATTDTLTNKVIGTTSTTTVSANTATTIDTNALNAFTTVKYVVSIKQGSKIRSSEIIAHTDGTNVDYTEFGITETGGTMSGILVEAVAVSTNAVLRVTITDAATTNATVKIQEVLI